MKRTQHIGGTTLVALLIAAGATPAAATEAPEERISQLIESVAPFQGQTRDGDLDSEMGTFTTGSVSVPVDPSQPLRVEGGAGMTLEVSLPPEAKTALGTQASDGTVVYESDDDGAHIASQMLSNDALRVQTILPDRNAAREYTYTIGDGLTPVKTDDGSLWVVGFAEGGEFEAFSVGEAWARDAHGATVATHYEVEGQNIIQVVTPEEDAAYPIVADPTWQWYSAAYGAGFSKSETRKLANAGAVAGFCGLLPGTLAVVCGVAGAQWFLQASLAAQARQCVFIAAAPAPIALRWLSNQCK